MKNVFTSMFLIFILIFSTFTGIGEALTPSRGLAAISIEGGPPKRTFLPPIPNQEGHSFSISRNSEGITKDFYVKELGLTFSYGTYNKEEKELEFYVSKYGDKEERFTVKEGNSVNIYGYFESELVNVYTINEAKEGEEDIKMAREVATFNFESFLPGADKISGFLVIDLFNKDGKKITDKLKIFRSEPIIKGKVAKVEELVEPILIGEPVLIEIEEEPNRIVNVDIEEWFTLKEGDKAVFSSRHGLERSVKLISFNDKETNFLHSFSATTGESYNLEFNLEEGETYTLDANVRFYLKDVDDDEISGKFERFPDIGIAITSNCKIIQEKPTFDPSWTDIRLDTEARPEIKYYRIKWFTGPWSRWYEAKKDDYDWKDRGRRVWAYFEDHIHEYVSCEDEGKPKIIKSKDVIPIQQNFIANINSGQKIRLYQGDYLIRLNGVMENGGNEIEVKVEPGETTMEEITLRGVKEGKIAIPGLKGRIVKMGKEGPTEIEVVKENGITKIKNNGYTVLSKKPVMIEGGRMLFQIENKQKEIKVLPHEIRDLVRNVEEIELEVEKEELMYRIKQKRNYRLFGIIPASAIVETKISAEDKEVLGIKRPFWAGLAREVE